MSVIPQQHFNMQSSANHHITHSASSSDPVCFGRKRFLDADDLLDGSSASKKSRTAPPSPPLMASFRSKSLSPSSIQPATLSSSKPLRTPLSPPPTTFSLPTPLTPNASIHSASSKATKLPSIHHITSEINAAGGASTSSTSPTVAKNVPTLKYLSQNTRYGNSNHSLDYPDTCVNDDDWRMNLEFWIEKNFPEKFNNLKNVLRFDKPGFDLLNDAILLNELKEKLDQQYSKKPSFNSRISKKMMSPGSRKNNYVFNKRVAEPTSDDESYTVLKQWNHTLSPIAQTSTINQINLHHQTQPPNTLPSRNYTYQSTPLPTSLIIHRQKKSSPVTSPIQPSWTGSSINATPTTSSNTDTPILLKSDAFIHTQNHKGPNHTYTIHHHNMNKRRCISCGSDQSPCWRPSWSTTAGQLCNSCGLRYKKTGARCTIDTCRRIPAKGEWAAMKQRGKVEVINSVGGTSIGYSCLDCGGEVEVKEKATS